MKWSPRDAIALHAAQVLADPKSKEEDMVSARKAIENPFSQEALDALPDEELERLHSEAEARLAEHGPRCIRCSKACVSCAMAEA